MTNASQHDNALLVARPRTSRSNALLGAGVTSPSKSRRDLLASGPRPK